MTVRRLTSDEWKVARAIRLRALRESPEAFASTLEEELQRPDQWWMDGAERLAWFVAEEHGEVVGVVAGMATPDGPEVVSMWLAPACRGSGLADDLLASVTAWAESQGAASLCLAVADGNDRARRFYERAGFEVTGPGEPLRSRPAVCTIEMRRSLSSAGST